MEPNEIQDQLGYFIGTERYYRYQSNLVLTDGSKFVADASELSALYKDLIGYDPFEEGESFESVKATLLDYVREECYLAGIHVSEVGL